MGTFPNLSRNVLFCPRLSSFGLLGARNGDKSEQKRTNWDKTGHFGTNWETPPFGIYPHLALLKISLVIWSSFSSVLPSFLSLFHQACLGFCKERTLSFLSLVFEISLVNFKQKNIFCCFIYPCFKGHFRRDF